MTDREDDQLPDEIDMLNPEEHECAPLTVESGQSVFAVGDGLEAEIFMSAGPRKRDLAEGDDTQLGEDASGVLIRNDTCYFWLADGASDSDKIHGNGEVLFSSRILAQDLGALFIKEVKERCKTVPAEDLKDIFLTVLDKARQEWQRRLSEIKTQDAPSMCEKNSLDFSAVFLCGCLKTDRSLSVIYYGDAEFIYQKDGKVEEPPSNKHRFFLRINKGVLISDWTVVTTKEHKLGPQLNTTHVNWVIAGTDGSKLLSVVKKLEEPLLADPMQSLHEHLRIFKPRSWDDKTLCVVRVV